MNEYCLSGQMKRAGNSDSETHVKRLNPTSRTEIKRKPRKYLFLETPCSIFQIISGPIFPVIQAVAPT